MRPIKATPVIFSFDSHYRMSKMADGKMNNGYAFLEFSSPEECKKALQYCRQETFRGHKLYAVALSSFNANNEENVLEV